MNICEIPCFGQESAALRDLLGHAVPLNAEKMTVCLGSSWLALLVLRYNLRIIVSCWGKFPCTCPFVALTCSGHIVFTAFFSSWSAAQQIQMSTVCTGLGAGSGPVLKSEHLNNFFACIAFLGVNCVGASIAYSFFFSWQEVGDCVLTPPYMVTAMLTALGELLLLSSSVWGEHPSGWAKKLTVGYERAPLSSWGFSAVLTLG